MIPRIPCLHALLLATLLWGIAACDENESITDCNGAVGCSMEPKYDTTFHEWVGLDTLVLPGSIRPFESVLAVVAIPAGCGSLESVTQDRRGDTLMLRPRLFYGIIRSAPCAHGPVLDSIDLGPANELFQSVSWIAYPSSRTGSVDTVVKPAPAVTRP